MNAYRNTVEALAEKGGFIPTSMFQNCADLDGSAAHVFLQQCGYAVHGHMDIGTNGVAWTSCGVILSTNGYVVRDPERAAKLHEQEGLNVKTRLAAKRGQR